MTTHKRSITRLILASDVLAAPLAPSAHIFSQLWSLAIRKLQQDVAADSFYLPLLIERIPRCTSVDDIYAVLDDITKRFASFRTGGSTTGWNKLRNRLKPAVEIFLLLNDTIAEAGSAHVPGGKAIFVALGVLLEATKGVTAYFEALVELFEELSLFLEGLRPRLQGTSFGPGTASRTITISILSHLIIICFRALRLLSRNTWLARLNIYRKALIKDNDMQKALERLRALARLEERAITIEIQVMQSKTLAVTEETRALASEMLPLLHDVRDDQEDVLGILRSEEQHRAKVDISEILEKLSPVRSAEIDSQRGPRCMEGTRVGVLSMLREWSNDEEAPRIFWLNGMAGTGKSAIARSFSHELGQSGLLGGSFFCSRNRSAAESDAQRIIPTLAVAMASRDVSFNTALLAALERKPFSKDWNLEVQIDRLLMTPFSGRLSQSSDSYIPIFVVDALDECSDEDLTRHLVESLVKISARLPVKFFLTSRPEQHIRQKLEQSDSGSGSWGRTLRLHDIEQDLVEADISLYLTHELKKMREQSFPPDWPSSNQVATLTRLSGKLFIYAFTALAYIRRIPVLRLGKLTEDSAISAQMTKPLDHMYEMILIEAMNTDTDEAALTKRIISIVLTVREPMSVAKLGELVHISAHRLRDSLSHLYAVIYVPRDNDSGALATFHASFGDFLTSPSRAPASMYVDIAGSHSDLASICIGMLRSDRLCFNLAHITSSEYVQRAKGEMSTLVPASLRYASIHWAYHITASNDQAPLWSAVEEFFIGPKFLFWLEALSVVGMTSHLDNIGRLIHKHVHKMSPRLSMFIRDGMRFALRFLNVIAASPPHIYLSALPLADKSSDISQRCLHAFTGLAKITWDVLDPPQYRGTLYNYPASAVFSPDGARTFFAWGQEITVWDGLSGTRVVSSTIKGHTDMISAISISADGTIIVSGSYDQTIGIWNIRTQELVTSSRLTGHTSGIECVALSSDDTKIASGDWEGVIRIWSSASGEMLGEMTSSDAETVCSIAFIDRPNQELRLVSTSSDSLLRIWDVQEGPTPTALLRGHTDRVTCVAVSADGTHIVSGSKDRTIRLWATTGGSPIKILVGHETYATSVAWSPDGTKIASGGRREVFVWDPVSGARLSMPIPGSRVSYVNSICFSPNCRYLLASYGNVIHRGAVRVWDIGPQNDDSRIATGGSKLRISREKHFYHNVRNPPVWVYEPVENKKLMLLNDDAVEAFETGLDPNYLWSVGDQGRLTIDTSDMVYGTEWTKCYNSHAVIPK